MYILNIDACRNNNLKLKVKQLSLSMGLMLINYSNSIYMYIYTVLQYCVIYSKMPSFYLSSYIVLLLSTEIFPVHKRHIYFHAWQLTFNLLRAVALDILFITQQCPTMLTVNYFLVNIRKIPVPQMLSRQLHL